VSVSQAPTCSSGSTRRSNAVPAWWGSSPTTRRSHAWWARCCWSRTSTGSPRAGACSPPRAWPKSQRWRTCRPRPACRKQPPEPRPQLSGGAAPGGRRARQQQRIRRSQQPGINPGERLDKSNVLIHRE
jgi:hypothetical protein